MNKCYLFIDCPLPAALRNMFRDCTLNILGVYLVLLFATIYNALQMTNPGTMNLILH